MQCNGHLICKGCIKKLNNCPICRNDSPPARSLTVDNIIQRLEGIQPENGGPTTGKSNPQKWGKVKSYGTINSHIEINLHARPEQPTWPGWDMPGWATPGWSTPGWILPRLATPRQTVSRPGDDQNVEASVPGQENNQELWTGRAPLQGDTWSNCIRNMIVAFVGCILIVFLFFGLLSLVGNFDFF